MLYLHDYDFRERCDISKKVKAVNFTQQIKTNIGKKMIKYYQKADDAGEINSQQALKRWKKYLYPKF